jgi:hypothetical protein
MIDLSTFLMRWFFLCGLMRDGPEIQTLPYTPHVSMPAPIQEHYPEVPVAAAITNCEETWRSHCLHGILSYPPGSQRELVMDAMREQLVHQLDHYLKNLDLVTNHTTIATTGTTSTSTNKKQIRDFLPQLVSAVLRSPSPPQPNLVNPVQRLRQLILRRCQQDPNWGIELCWLLETEVGRNWKSMFEHLQQPGKRLIIAFPADKAVALAKIGAEKGEAFDLLQDVEQVTAYGSDNLPSSISLLRCSHYGDTMHFIDRLTQISLDLRQIPAISRLVSLLLVGYGEMCILFLNIACH